MNRRLLVIGGGVAGVAAAWAARRRGVEVRLFHGPAGATELAPGTADFEPWSAPRPLGQGGAEPVEEGKLSSEEEGFLQELQYWRAGETLVVTSAGVIRPCLARDPALLDLGELGGRAIAVAEVERDDWDGASLARTLSSSPWARRTGARFEAVPLPLLQHSSERRIPLMDFAALQDDPTRRDDWCARLRDWRARAPEFDALLLGPWLGLAGDTARRVQQTLPFPLGECTSLPGGPAGFRFAEARRALLEKVGVDLVEERVRSVQKNGSAWEVSFERSDRGPETSDAVLLAVGGFVSGGLEFRPRQETGAAFGLTLEAPVLFGVTDEPLEQVSSTYGFDPVTAKGAWIERAGVLVDAKGNAGPSGLLAAGEVVAGAPRTILSAVRSALAAVASHFDASPRGVAS